MLNNAVEMVAKVQPDLSVKVLVATDLGTNIGTCPVSSRLAPRVLPRMCHVSSRWSSSCRRESVV